MKLIYKLLWITALTAAIALTSCSKNPDDIQPQGSINLTVGFKVLGQWVTLSIGNGGGYYYNQSAYAGYNYYNNNSVTTIGYIRALPLDETRIPIFDQRGLILGNANLPSGTGSETNVAITQIRNWFRNGNGPLPVLVDWHQRWTSAPWDGTIIAY